MQAELTEQKDGAMLRGGGGAHTPVVGIFLGTLWYVHKKTKPDLLLPWPPKQK